MNFVIGIPAALILLGLVAWGLWRAVHAYWKLHGRRIVTCPETGQPAAVDPAMWHIALTAAFRGPHYNSGIAPGGESGNPAINHVWRKCSRPERLPGIHDVVEMVSGQDLYSLRETGGPDSPMGAQSVPHEPRSEGWGNGKKSRRRTSRRYWRPTCQWAAYVLWLRLTPPNPIGCVSPGVPLSISDSIVL